MAPRSRGEKRPSFASSGALFISRGRREDRVLAAPAVSRAICANKTAHEHTGQREHSGLPCAMALRLTSCSSRRTARYAERVIGEDSLLALRVDRLAALEHRDKGLDLLRTSGFGFHILRAEGQRETVLRTEFRQHCLCLG